MRKDRSVTLGRASKQSNEDMAKLKKTIKENRTTVRLPVELAKAFRSVLVERDKRMNVVITELIESWVSQEPRFRRFYTPEQSLEAKRKEGDCGVSHDSIVELLRSYVRWIPAAIIVKELRGRIICANENFLELVGKRNVIGDQATDHLDSKSADAINKHDETVRTTKAAILCAERIRIGENTTRRITLRFPILHRREVDLIGVLGFNVDDVLRHVPTHGSTNYKIPRTHREIEFSQTFDSDSVLTSFAEFLPAIATVKNLEGRLLCVNPEYTRVTGKEKAEVFGRLPTENWPAETAHTIMLHDQLVRETQSVFMTVNTLPSRGQAKTDRFNVRFPIFDSGGRLEYTGSFGFDHDLMLRALKVMDSLDKNEDVGAAFLPLEGE